MVLVGNDCPTAKRGPIGMQGADHDVTLGQPRRKVGQLADEISGALRGTFHIEANNY
jgi:hypothetical protein